MRLHSAAFERNLRRQIRQRLRRSPQLRREYRASRKVRTGVWTRRCSRLFWTGLVAACVLGAWNATQHAATALAVLNLWSLILALWAAQDLLGYLGGAPDLPALMVLPVADGDIVAWEQRQFVRRSGIVLLDLLAGLIGLTWLLRVALWGWWVAVALAALGWGLILALAFHAATWLPRFPHRALASGLVFLGCGAVATRHLFDNASVTALDHLAPALNRLLPSGWVPSLFELLLPGRQWATLALLAPVAIVLGGVGTAVRVLRNRWSLDERVAPAAGDMVPGEAREVAPAVETSDAPASPRLGPTAIEELVGSGAGLQPLAWSQQGWLEARLWQWLEPRERVLAEFAFPNGIALTRPWWRLARLWAGASVVGLLAGRLEPRLEIAVIGLGLFVTLCQAVARVLDTGAAFRAMFSSGVRIPLHAGFPIGFKELAHLLLKYSAIQVPLLVPFMMASGALVGHLAGFGVVAGVVPGLKAALLLGAGRCGLLALAFSAGTNDTTRFRGRTILLLAVVLGQAGLFLALSITGLVLSYPAYAWLCVALAAADAYLFLRVYGRFYDANRFDLMSLPPSPGL